MKFSTCFGATSGKNLISISPNLVLMIACGSIFPPPAGFLSSAPKTGAAIPTSSNDTMSTPTWSRMSFFLLTELAKPRTSINSAGILNTSSASLFPELLQGLLGRHLLRVFLAFTGADSVALAPDQDFHLEQFLMIRPRLPGRPVMWEHLELPLADFLEIGLEVPRGEKRPIARGQFLAERGLDARRCRVEPPVQVHPGQDRLQGIRQDGGLAVSVRLRLAAAQTEQVPKPNPSRHPGEG